MIEKDKETKNNAINHEKLETPKIMIESIIQHKHMKLN